MNKQTNQTFIFNGYLTAEGPLSTTLPGLADKKPSSQNPMPTPIPKMGLKMYMPGAGIKGLLRHHGSMAMVEAFKEQTGKQIDLQSYYINTKGGIKGGGKETAIPLEMINAFRQKNPVVSLHGASTPWLTGKLIVTNAIVTKPIEPVVISGVRKDDLRNPIQRATMIEFLNPEAFEEWAQSIDETKENSDAGKAIKELQKQLKNATEESEILRLTAELEGIKQSKKDKGFVSAQLPLTGYEAIPVGAELEQKIILRNGSLIELGVLLLSLNRWAYDAPILGAHAATGGGLFNANWEVTSAGETIGSVKFTPWVGIEVQGQLLDQAMNEARQYLATQAFDPRLPDDLRELINKSDKNDADGLDDAPVKKTSGRSKKQLKGEA